MSESNTPDVAAVNAEGTPHDQAFLEFVVRELVDHPDAVRVQRTVDEMGVLLTLEVHPDDMGKVIGRSGATARAIRSLLRAVGMKYHARVNLKIVEPSRGGENRASQASAPVSSAVSQERDEGAGPEEALQDVMEELKQE